MFWEVTRSILAETLKVGYAEHCLFQVLGDVHNLKLLNEHEHKSCMKFIPGQKFNVPVDDVSTTKMLYN